MPMLKKKHPMERRFRELKEAFEHTRQTCDQLEAQVKLLRETCTTNTLTIYSADNDICIGMHHPLWHKIVCEYDSKGVCLGPPRDHWKSQWDIKEDGFHLKEFTNSHNNISRGWRGQYNPSNELKYDELPQIILNKHHTHLVEHIKKMAIWYPCHIYNDFTGELCRP